ncbi:PQQ-dependent sugar dehydrogenase [Exilibacterium tricleocarpae]|uniref:PQQ-dependent sugar dehydrogenase n=1 Tax=Exilibacterium tricleocarpae TaxID=2591008 RepID=A0A545SXF4_9GAMM|nr:PQQ-dependent sugar dehydrogenase [Exilibacterium tricleocarpae]TQV69644.1 PQQ-dependent sugar dehydrogenase [Exilibacterium tricleocarpae]
MDTLPALYPFAAVNRLLVCLLLLPLFSACQAPPPPDPPVSITRVVVSSGLARPWDIAFLSEREALVTEKQGGIKRVDLVDGSHNAITGLPDDLDNLVREDARDNSGLFGIALDPQFEATGWVYFAYSALEKSSGTIATATKVVRARLQDDVLVDMQTLAVAGPFSADRFHYGGGLVFGPDGKLYITFGERFLNEVDQPPLPVAQNKADLRGAIHRINPDGSLPVDNPDWGAAPGTYATGIRAAQGLTVHPDTGDIWFSEHGARRGDEINVLAPAANYGWPVVTDGAYRDESYRPPQPEGITFTPPRWSWEETVAPTGLTFYTGSEFPAWRGDLFVAGLSRGSLWRLQVNDSRIVAAEKLFTEDPVRLRQVKQGLDGKLYMLTDESDGRILRIEKG